MLPMQSVPYSVAHRGGHIKGYVPENSPDGVASAKRYGFRAIECDVHYTKDNKLIHMHDRTINRTMVNASDLAFAFDKALPAKKRPQFTKDREGFNHLVEMRAGVDEAKMHYIIRNHDRALLEEQKKEFEAAKEAVLKQYPNVRIELDIKDDYRNMKEKIELCPECVERVNAAYEKLGYPYYWQPIRGGTDGAGFSFKGVPTPNLPTGSFNHHGRFEYLSIGEFEKIKNVLIEILKA